MNDSTVDFAEDVGVRLTVQRARIRLSADWGAQLGTIQDKGSVEVRVHDLAVVAVLGVSVDGSGRPMVWSAGCDAHVTDLHVEFHYGHSWLYNPLAPLLQKALRQELNKQLCLELHKGVCRLEAALKHMKTSTQLDAFAAIDHSLVGQPAITAEHGDIALKGEFFRVGKSQQRPSSAVPVVLPTALPAALPTALPTAQEPMLLLAVTEFVANSAALTYFTAGVLRKNISSDMLPRRFPLQLRTKSMGLFSPQLQQRYPDYPMELHLSARRQPLLSCHPDALHGAFFGSAEAFVVLPNATRVPAFLLNIDANVTGKPTITRNRLGGTVSLKGLSVSQVTSHVGPVEVSCRAGARWGIRGEPCALHHPGSGVWGSGRGLGVLGTPCKASTCTDSGCSPGRGAEPCQRCSPLCLPHARLRGLPVPQVKRLETLLKFGLWLFGVPWANSECCPHPVPVPPPQLPPTHSSSLPTERLQAGVPLPTLHGLSPLNAQLSLQEVGAATIPSPCCPPHPPCPPPHLTPTPRRASCSSPRTCSTSHETSHCVGTCRPPPSRVPVPIPLAVSGEPMPPRPRGRHSCPAVGPTDPQPAGGGPRQGLKPGAWFSLVWGVVSSGAPAAGSPGQGPIPSSVLEHRRVPPAAWSSGHAGVRGPIPCAGVPTAPPGGGIEAAWGA
ncbi:lipopolysaccharide-binding protein-like isoform 1-T1 [Morphnus guianensis]